jgi:hypothetical protein
MDFKPYNKKAFLLPDSINSAAMYHAKLFPDGKYVFRIHDCLGGIRLVGELKEESDYVDAAEKLMTLAKACNEFALHFLNLKAEILPENKKLREKLKKIRQNLYTSME